MYFIGLGTAVPATRYLQTDGWESVRTTPAFATLRPRSQAILRKVLLGDNGIESRHLALNSLDEAYAVDPDTLHQRFRQHAPDLATGAARQALADARLDPADVDAVVATTCTGYLCPGLTSFLAERLGLRRTIVGLDLVGLGCGAALPALQVAQAYLRSGLARRVLVVCAEVCSAAFYLDDDPGVLISACLFGDGAAAAVLAAEPVPHTRSVRWHSWNTRMEPADREKLRFETCRGMLRNILTLEVPSLAARHAGEVCDELLAREGLDRSAIREWILHAGGRDVLNALQRRWSLPDSALRHSAGVLREHGNLSSPSVLFALASARAEAPEAGWWWMSSFGAGFTCHGALLEVGKFPQY